MSRSGSPSWETWQDPPNGSSGDLNVVLRVITSESESSNCTSLFFERPRGFAYGPGDWVDLRFLAPELAVGRTFSFSSSPSEADLRITFKHGISPFKRELIACRPGDTLLITQFGSNGFKMTPRKHAIMIAGGVGIAPFRSMLRAALDSGVSVSADVVFVRRGSDMPFREEMASWREIAPGIRIHDVITGSGRRLDATMLRQIVDGADAGQPRYYVAGPPGMVDSARATLLGLGAATDHILTDRFEGYE